MAALRTACVMLVVVPLAACAQRPTQDVSAVNAEVTAALDAFYNAMKSGDTAAAMAMIAPDAQFVESGRLETRDEYETNHLPADIAFESQVAGRRNPPRITVEGDTAWVIATTDFDGTFDGRPVSFVSAQLAVLTRGEEGWRIRAIHWSSRPQ